MKYAKKLLCFLLVLIIALISVIPAFATDVTHLTFLYIDKGNIIIGDNSVSGYGLYGEYIEEYDPDGYCITSSVNSDSSNTVTFNGGENYVVFMNLNIKISYSFDAAVCLTENSKVHLFVTGDNNITSGRSRAGIEIQEGSELIIDGDGSLNTKSGGQAGIGGGNGGSNGSLVINSGTITATCTSESAGIGGGSSGSGGNIIINGGNVTANGGSYGAGIGGGCASDGGNIIINGGTVTATGGSDAAGIGGGWYGEMGTVVINGGSVKASGGGSAPAIGAGKQTSSSYPVDSNGNHLYLTNVSASAYGTFNKIFVNGRDANISGFHLNDSKYYFYVPVGTNFVSCEPVGQGVVIFKSVISSAGQSNVTSVNPVTVKNGAQIGKDNIIRGITCGLTNLDDFLVLSSGYSLRYDNSFIGTGTKVILMFGDKEVYAYRALLYGDTDNSGWYDGQDSFYVFLMLWQMITEDNTDALVFEAADADRDGRITENDLHLLESAGLLISSVYQGDVSEKELAVCEQYFALIDQTPVSFEENTSSNAENDTTDLTETSKSNNIFDYILSFIKYVIKALLSLNIFYNTLKR